MSATNKLRNKLQRVSGRAKESIGRVTGDRKLESRGVGRQVGKVSEHVEPSGLTGEARERVAAELARLQERRDRLEAEVRNDRGAVSDHADAADAIQRADELVGLDERLAELDRLLHAGPAPSNGDELPFGTVVRLQFSDGEVVTMQAISVTRSLCDRAEALPPPP